MTNTIETLKLMQSEIEWDYPMEYAAAIDQAIEALEWIPCSERLPEITTDVLVTTINYGVYVVHIAYYSGETGKWYWYETPDRQLPDTAKVIAWRPLPEPYMEESGGMESL